MMSEERQLSNGGGCSTDDMNPGHLVWYKREPVQYFISICTGIAAGIILNVFGVSDDIITLVTLPGNLFLRALQCAVIPMIFFNIATSVASIFGSGGSGSLGSKAIILYSASTVLAITQGILAANAYSFLFQSDLGESDDDDGVKVSFVCPKSFGVLTTTQDGDLLCVHHDQLGSYNLTSSYQNYFLRDEEDMLVNGVILKQSLVDQVLNTAFSVVPDNAVQSFATPSIISVIVIGIAFGMAMTIINTRTRGRGGCQDILQFCSEMSDVTNEVITWIISIAPACIGFLVAASLASAGNLVDLMSSVGIYVASALTGMAVHLCITLPLVFFWYTGGNNPYKWLYSVREPLIIAFSTESSAAALPVSIKAAVATGQVEDTTANTILPLGATVNMDGTAIGFPCAISFLAHSARVEGSLNISTWINIAIGASLGSAGTAPVPNAAIIMLITVWETAIPGSPVPDAIAYVQAIAFLVSRFQTTVNVASDLFIARMIQHGLDAERKKAESHVPSQVSSTTDESSTTRVGEVYM